MDTALGFESLRDPLAVWIAAACLAALMGHAGISKLADRDLLAQHLSAYRVADRLLPAAVWVLPLAECLGACLLLSAWRPLGAAWVAGLLLLYGAAMAWHLLAGRRLDCGCGGAPLPLSWALVLRNLLLLGLCGLAAAQPLPRSLGWADFGVTVAALLLGALLWAAFHQVLRQQRPGSTV